MDQTYEDRRKKVTDYLEKCKADKMACGGTVKKMAAGGLTIGPDKPVVPSIGPDSGDLTPSDEVADLLSKGQPTPTGQSVIDTIKAGLSGAGKAMSNLIPSGMAERAAGAVESATPAIREGGPAIVNAALGTNLPTPPPSPTPPSPSAPVFDVAPETPPVKTSNKSPAGAESAASSSTPFQDLFNQDASKLTKGFNPEDRQALVQNMLERQRSGRNIIAEALAGFGDAISARGGVNTDHLGKLIALESDQRKEALGNFDAARQAAVQNFTLKTQMGENAIKQLAAKDAYGLADPNLATQIGAPKGTLNKDLPLYLQIYTAKANQHIAEGNQTLAAVKQASEENDAYNKAPGALHARQTPEERHLWISNRTNDLMAQSHGLVKVQQHGKVGYLPAADFQKARKSDPSIQQVGY